MSGILKKHLLPGGRLARGDVQASVLAEAEYKAAEDKIRQKAGQELRALLRDRSYDNAVLNIDHVVRNYLNEDGATMVCGELPALGNLTVDQYLIAASRFAKGMSPELKTLMNSSDRSVILRLDRTALLSGATITTNCGSQPGDLGVMSGILKKHLLPGGRLARGDVQAPVPAEAEYKAAEDKIRQKAGQELRALLRDRGYANAVLNIDYFIRNYLNKDGATMVRGELPALGNLTVDQYLIAASRFAKSMSPELKTLMNSSDPSVILRLDRMIRGG